MTLRKRLPNPHDARLCTGHVASQSYASLSEYGTKALFRRRGSKLGISGIHQMQHNNAIVADSPNQWSPVTV